MTANEENLLVVAFRYAEVCRECETRRADGEPAPKPLWQDAWKRRMALLSELMAAATALVTDPLAAR